jgi:hypothetical protein
VMFCGSIEVDGGDGVMAGRRVGDWRATAVCWGAALVGGGVVARGCPGWLLLLMLGQRRAGAGPRVLPVLQADAVLRCLPAG